MSGNRFEFTDVIYQQLQAQKRRQEREFERQRRKREIEEKRRMAKLKNDPADRIRRNAMSGSLGGAPADWKILI